MIMNNYTKEELTQAQNIICSIIKRCENIQPKFTVGTAQHTLLKNRKNALILSCSLINNENISGKYTKEQLSQALSCIDSIITKCEKAAQKYETDSTQHARFYKIIKAMSISQILIKNELIKK